MLHICKSEKRQGRKEANDSAGKKRGAGPEVGTSRRPIHCHGLCAAHTTHTRTVPPISRRTTSSSTCPWTGSALVPRWCLLYPRRSKSLVTVGETRNRKKKIAAGAVKFAGCAAAVAPFHGWWRVIDDATAARKQIPMSHAAVPHPPRGCTGHRTVS